jgi:hypothetical protein
MSVPVDPTIIDAEISLMEECLEMVSARLLLFKKCRDKREQEAG